MSSLSDHKDQEHSILNHVEKHLEDSIKEYFNRIYRKERSVDRTLILLKLIQTIKSISDEELSDQIVDELLRSNRIVGCEHRDSEPSVLKCSGKINIIKRLQGRRKIKASEIFTSNMKAQDLLDYIWLRKHGYLRRMEGGKLYINPNLHSNKLIAEENRTVTLMDLVKYLKEIPSKFWSKIINENLLRKLNTSELVEFITRFHGFNRKVDQDILAEISRRSASMAGFYSSEWKWIKGIVKKIAKKGGLSNYLGPYSLQWLNPESLDHRILAKALQDIRELPLKERWKIVSKINRIRGYREIIKELDPLTLAIIKNPGKFDTKLKNRILIGQALAYYLDYALTGNRPLLDFAVYTLSKIDPHNLEQGLRPIYRSLISRDHKSILRSLSKEYLAEALEYLSQKVWEHFSMHGVDYNTLWRAINLGYEIIKYRIKGTEAIGKYRESPNIGKVYLKKTVYNYIRQNFSIVRRSRERVSRIIAVIDVSGSMLRHSVWAIISLSAIIPVIKTIILFSDSVYVSKPPRRASRGLVLDYLEKLFINGFKGYTNISLALRALDAIAGNSDIAVLFSDLEQTVRDVEPWVEASKYLSRGSRRLILFVPPRHRTDIGRLLTNAGAELIVVDDPLKLPRILRRKLNLKIRVNIFPSKRIKY